MKLSNLKYGLLITASTFFGGSSFEMFAQTPQGHVVQMNDKKQYKQHFFSNVTPEQETLKVTFMVDSIENITANGDLLTDINVIELLAYLDPDGEEYQNYLANRHVVAHEMWHRICMMKGVMENPVSATQLRTELDNFEITASIVSVLTFRDDYIKATPQEREVLEKINDPKIRMYVQAIRHGVINPLSDDKKDFDFEMKFIASTVSQFWNNNMSESYAPKHNEITEQSGRKEFEAPVYQKNFIKDIKTMNVIGGIDFSQYYDYTDIHYRKEFAKGNRVETKVLDRSLSTPDYETWVNKKSRLKRYSRQVIEVPNFTGNKLAEERQKRPKQSRVQPYEILPKASGYKVIPNVQTIIYAAAELKSNKATLKFYPTGSMDKITPTEDKDVANIVSYNFDGSMEKGKLVRGKKDGTFIYYDKNKHEIARCVFKNGRAVDGKMVVVINDNYIFYHYKQGKSTEVNVKNANNTTVASCRFDKGKPSDGLLARTDVCCDLKFDVYQKGRVIAELELDKSAQVSEKMEHHGDVLKIERFYPTGEPLYQAVLGKKDVNEELYTPSGRKAAVSWQTNQRKKIKIKTENLQNIVIRAPMPSQAKQRILRSMYRPSVANQSLPLRREVPQENLAFKAGTSVIDKAPRLKTNQITPTLSQTPARVVPSQAPVRQETKPIAIRRPLKKKALPINQEQISFAPKEETTLSPVLTASAKETNVATKSGIQMVPGTRKNEIAKPSVRGVDKKRTSIRTVDGVKTSAPAVAKGISPDIRPADDVAKMPLRNPPIKDVSKKTTSTVMTALKRPFVRFKNKIYRSLMSTKEDVVTTPVLAAAENATPKRNNISRLASTTSLNRQVKPLMTDKVAVSPVLEDKKPKKTIRRDKKFAHLKMSGRKKVSSLLSLRLRNRNSGKV